MKPRAHEGPSLHTTEACRCAATLQAIEGPKLRTEGAQSRRSLQLY